jgi:hypothetical protein
MVLRKVEQKSLVRGVGGIELLNIFNVCDKKYNFSDLYT